jgi:hypothetical protein
MAAGIRQRHGNRCSGKGRCDCPWEGFVFDARESRKIRKTFPTRAAAKTWRSDALVAVRQGRMRAATSATVEEVAEAWLDGAREGTVRNRSGDRYKPSAIRSYERSLRLRIYPELGARRLSEVRRSDLQDVVDRLVGEGHAASTIQSTLIPLKSICRREINRGRLALNPTTGLELPAVRGGRDRIADPAEAAKLLADVSAGRRRCAPVE